MNDQLRCQETGCDEPAKFYAELESAGADPRLQAFCGAHTAKLVTGAEAAGIPITQFDSVMNQEVQMLTNKYRRIPPPDGRHLWTVRAWFRVNDPEPPRGSAALLGPGDVLVVEGPVCVHCFVVFQPGLQETPCPKTN